MCGISGYFSTNNFFSRKDLEAMTNAVAHRGPDAEGFYSDEFCGLGHRRLSIIDLSSRANQPLTSANDRYVIIYNGEVYNFTELGAQIKGITGHTNDPIQFRTNSDTEVILEAFSAYGVDFVHQLNGMFAIAIYDKVEKALYIFRDRLGIKPLYYYYDGKNFAFASELKSLQELKQLQFNVNENSIKEFLHLGYIPAPGTIYKNFFKLESGSWIKINKDGIEKHRYWAPQNKLSNTLITDKEQALVKISDLIMSSVQYQLKSDVPFGVFLSGGIDSSLITAQAVGLSSIKVNTFSIGFEENSHSESEYAKAVARYLNTDHHEFIVSYKDAINLIEQVLEIYDEPMADSSSIPTMLVSKLAKQYVTVTLSGEGGDELFYGYGSHLWAKRLSNPLLNASKRVIASGLSHFSSRYQRIGKLLDFPNNVDRKSHIFSQEQYFFSENEINNLLVNKTSRQISLFQDQSYRNFLRIQESQAYPDNLQVKERHLTPMEQQALFDLNYYLQDDLLVKVDRASMFYSLETRVPYLDHRLVELALNIHPSLKYKNGVSKYILKEILYQYVPRQLFNRPKQGFAIPLNKWLKNELRYLIDEYLSEENIRRFNVVDYKEVKKLINQFMSGTDYLYNRIWLLIVLHRWLKSKNAII
jgi:asparagine synthase (glutamine-hydrolysing)